jgi:Reverse transcriptase (RNA-dependent DNA polymerase)
MNSIFKSYLKKFVLVFFDNILIFSNNKEIQQIHLVTVLKDLKENQLFVKESKYAFGLREIEYLGHIISDKGVVIDPAKMAAMMSWQSS